MKFIRVGKQYFNLAGITRVADRSTEGNAEAEIYLSSGEIVLLKDEQALSLLRFFESAGAATGGGKSADVCGHYACTEY